MNRVPDFILEAVNNLRNGNHFNLIGTEVHWTEDAVNPPTQAEIDAEIARLKANYESKAYQRQRAPRYPSLATLADALYWSNQGDNTKLDEYYAACAAVKAKYPKPEVN